tara:strand:- start:252 stop:1400 length:1149 start_codon:yes stop_codon:yes gene_type:complete
MRKKVYTAIGLMTGTSMDGVDLSLIKSDGNKEFESISDNYYEFNDELYENLIKIRKNIGSETDLNKNSAEINKLEREMTLFHSKVIEDSLRKYDDEVDLIGFHGQTIFHNSDQKISRQLGDGSLLSQLSKKIVINNFREKDLQNGGQGAPLTPIFHKLISNKIHEKENIKFPLYVINIGGIANLTCILNNSKVLDSNLIAYDIGPGNCLIDEWIRKNSEKKFDENGNIANSGKVNDLILNQAIDSFSSEKYDTSLDINDFDLSFVRGLNLEDGCATLTNFTAYLIFKGIENMMKINKKENGTFLLCGGGRKNDYLINNIKKYFSHKNVDLKNIDDYGFDGDFIESQSFGFLAIRSFLGLPISFPETTRCKTPTLGGNINKNF